MELFFRTVGNGYPLVILHGLYGSSDNWLAIAGLLAHNFKVIIPDLRNHGRSPHSDEMDFEHMANDITELLKIEGIQECYLLGHSMGGKLAMKVAMDHPETIKKLIVVDVAPKSYLEGYSKHFEFHKNVVAFMNGLDMNKFNSRKEVEVEMLKRIGSEKVVMFLLKNLKKDKNGRFRWKLNVGVIYRTLHRLIDGVVGEEDRSFNNPTLFIRGLKSDYIVDEDIPKIERLFKNLQFVEVENAGHWVHAEQSGIFIQNVLSFLTKSN